MSVCLGLAVCSWSVTCHTPILAAPLMLRPRRTRGALSWVGAEEGRAGSSLVTPEPPSPWTPLVPEDPGAKCFAKAGKMEPNQLFNGFGPLQPAVAAH